MKIRHRVSGTVLDDGSLRDQGGWYSDVRDVNGWTNVYLKSSWEKVEEEKWVLDETLRVVYGGRDTVGTPLYFIERKVKG